MSIVLNGTTGITTPDVTSDGLTVDSTTLVVDEANNRVGIGTSSPSTPLDIVSTGAEKLKFTRSANIIGVQMSSTASDGWGFYDYARSGYDIYAKNGNMMVGTTSGPVHGNEKVGILNTSGHGLGIKVGNESNSPISLWNTGASGARNQILFYDSAAGGFRGSITTNGSATAYNTSSDYRLKEDWVAVADASTRVNALKPVNFAWKADGSRVDGFLAHEVAEVVPEAVTGEKDAVDAEGNPVYQGIDQSKLVPLLTAALQEALAKIDDLTARVSALEASNV